MIQQAYEMMLGENAMLYVLQQTISANRPFGFN